MKADPNKIITLKRECPECKKESEVKVKFKDHAAFFGGELIQDAFPYLSAAERELVKTGYCSSCYDAVASMLEGKTEEE